MKIFTIENCRECPAWKLMNETQYCGRMDMELDVEVFKQRTGQITHRHYTGTIPSWCPLMDVADE